jgi:hypothetical protein
VADSVRQACAGSDITGNTYETLLSFLATPDLPPYYRMKTHLALSGTDERDEPWENLASCHHNLKEAERALAECKNVYRDAGDVQLLRRQVSVIREEWAELQKRDGDSDDSD